MLREMLSAPLWRTENERLLMELIRSRTPLRLFYNVRYNRSNYDISATGHILEADKNQVRFGLSEFFTAEERKYPALPLCNINFVTERTLNKVRGRYGYRLVGHFPKPYRLESITPPPVFEIELSSRIHVRRMRSDPRVVWDAANVRNMGFFVLEGQLNTLDALSACIRNYLSGRSSAPVLRDISAGGCCLEVEPDAVPRLISGNQKYLFFVTVNAGTVSAPKTVACIFLCRKIAMSRHAGRIVFRLKFTHEAISNAEGRPGLHWEDIDAVASARLRGAITHFSVIGHELQTPCESIDESLLL